MPRRWRVRVTDVGGRDIDYRRFLLRLNAERYARFMQPPSFGGRALYSVTVERDDEETPDA